MDDIQSPGGEHFRDCRRWISVVGLIEILIGGLCGLCGLLFSLLSPFFRQNPATENLVRGGMLTANVLALVAAAALFVWIGVGTIRVRRWARDMMLVAAWVWLIVGAAALVLVFITIPRRLQELSGPGQAPPDSGEIAGITAILLVIAGFPYVVLPGLFVLFYDNRNVRKTFENRDRSAPWTSKCPLSVLTLCQFLACGALMSLAAAFYTDALPVGSRVITGVPARLIIFAFLVLNSYLTWAVYKLKLHAWWLNLFFTILCYAWFYWSNSVASLTEFSSSIGLSAQVDRGIVTADFSAGRMLSWFVAAFGAGYLVFLFLIKKHFKNAAHPETG